MKPRLERVLCPAYLSRLGRVGLALLFSSQTCPDGWVKGSASSCQTWPSAVRPCHGAAGTPQLCHGQVLTGKRLNPWPRGSHWLLSAIRDSNGRLDAALARAGAGGALAPGHPVHGACPRLPRLQQGCVAPERGPWAPPVP